MAYLMDHLNHWPEPFEGPTYKQYRAVINTLAADFHEGWVPTYEEVKILTDYVAGRNSADEYRQFAMDSAEAMRQQEPGEGKSGCPRVQAQYKLPTQLLGDE